MSTLKELIENSTDHSDYMVKRLWNQGNKVDLGPEATKLINVLKKNLKVWLDKWNTSEDSIKSLLIPLQEKALEDLSDITRPNGINDEMLKKGYVLAIAGQLAKNPDIIAIINDNPNRGNWPAIIKFIQSGEEGLQQRKEYKASLEQQILTGLPLLKKEIHSAAANEKISLAYRKIDTYDDQILIAHAAANNVIYALKNLGVSASTPLTKDQINELKEHLISNLKLLHDGFENLDPDTVKALSYFFRNNNNLIFKALEKITAPSRFTLRSKTNKEDVADLLDNCIKKAHAIPALELALLSIEAEYLHDGSIDRSTFFEKAKQTGLIGSAFISKWEEDNKEASKISSTIQTTGKAQFGDNFFIKAESAVSVALFLNLANKNVDDPSLIEKLKKLPTMGERQDSKWLKSTSAEKKKILVTLNEQATKIYGKELFNSAKNVVREKRSVTNANIKKRDWASVTPNKRFSGSSPKRDSKKGPFVV